MGGLEKIEVPGAGSTSREDSWLRTVFFTIGNTLVWMSK